MAKYQTNSLNISAIPSKSPPLRNLPQALRGLEKNPGEAADLRQVQTGLAELGYAPGEITGDLTSATIQAIIQFEKDRGLPSDGTVSSALLAEISR